MLSMLLILIIHNLEHYHQCVNSLDSFTLIKFPLSSDSNNNMVIFSKIFFLHRLIWNFFYQEIKIEMCHN